MNTELYLYEERKKARQEGQAEGVRQANEATARKMKASQMPQQQICEYTGLTAEEVAAL